jgi:hypothetical protein
VFSNSHHLNAKCDKSDARRYELDGGLEKILTTELGLNADLLECVWKIMFSRPLFIHGMQITWQYLVT